MPVIGHKAYTGKEEEEENSNNVIGLIMTYTGSTKSHDCICIVNCAVENEQTVSSSVPG
jgi:hypothetical protein